MGYKENLRTKVNVYCNWWSPLGRNWLDGAWRLQRCWSIKAGGIATYGKTQKFKANCGWEKCTSWRADCSRCQPCRSGALSKRLVWWNTTRICVNCGNLFCNRRPWPREENDIAPPVGHMSAEFTPRNRVEEHNLSQAEVRERLALLLSVRRRWSTCIMETNSLKAQAVFIWKLDWKLCYTLGKRFHKGEKQKSIVFSIKINKKSLFGYQKVTKDR